MMKLHSCHQKMPILLFSFPVIILCDQGELRKKRKEKCRKYFQKGMLAVFIVFLCLSVGLSRPLSLERGLKSPERCKRVHQKAPASTSWEDGHRASLTRIIARIDSPNISAGKAGWHAAVAGFIQVVMLMWLR